MHLLLLIARIALAGPADDLLARVDEASNRGGDAHLVIDVKTTEASGEAASRTLEIWQKGAERRLVKFTAPARLAGVGMLVPDGSTIYLYLPAYGRARRVVGEGRGDAFVGTDFAMEDLARITWAEEYAPELTAAAHLRLVPKPGVKAASARVEIDVRPDDHLPSQVEHYDASGRLIRRIRFEDVRPVAGRPLAHTVIVEDAVKSRTTTAQVTEAAFDGGLSDELFTLQTLTR